MNKFAIAAVAALSLAGSGAVYAQYQQHSRHMQHMQHMRMNPEDRAAFLDSRIAAVHAGLKLNADQEKLWPPVEAAVRDFAKTRMEQANARMNAREQGDKQTVDPVTRLRQRADNMATASAGLKKIADAADPLYKTLDEGQKRRLTALVHNRGMFGERGGRRGRFMERMERQRGGGQDRDEGRL